MSAKVEVAAMSLMALGACAASPHYSKPGGTDEEFQRQMARCRIMALQTPAGGGMMGAAMTMQVMQDCMRAEGWVRDN